MMRNWARVAALPLMLAMTTGCNGADKRHDDGGAYGADAGPATEKAFALDGFTGVEVAGPYDVTIRHGDAFAIRAKGPQAEIDKLRIERDGSTLSIGRERGSWSFRDHGNVTISITMPKLEALRLAGSGTIDADSVEGDAADLSVTGSGEIKIARLTAASAELDVSGSGDLDVAAGKIGSGSISITGSGDVEAGGLVAETLDVSVTGSGDVEAQATTKAAINVVGSGDVRVTGGANCSTSKTGSGNVVCS